MIEKRCLKNVVIFIQAILSFVLPRKFKNTTTFLPDNYLIKCAKHMLNTFSTINLSTQHKILTGLKDRFDLHKIL